MKTPQPTRFHLNLRGYLLLSICIILVGGWQKTQGQSLPSDSLHIVLVIGQSNMAGRADMEDQTRIPHVSLLNDQGDWVSAQNPLNLYSSVRKKINMQRLGPGYTFAQEMIKSKQYRPLGLVVNARGGTAIKEWMPGTELYNEAVRRTQQALAQGTLIGVLWHQGESDADSLDHYLSDLETLITSLRKDLGTPTLPFIVGQLSEDKPQRSAFNAMILQLPERVPYTSVVRSRGLGTFNDTHFNTPSQYKLGQRYARALKKLLKE